MTGFRNSLPAAGWFTMGLLPMMIIFCNQPSARDAILQDQDSGMVKDTAKETIVPVAPALDTMMYNKLMSDLVHDSITTRWPVKTEYPLPGAILPFHRIVAFYGNFLSKGMGILGAIPPDKMLEKLQTEVNRWQAADSAIVVKPALHYIAVTAQIDKGNDSKYRLRMPSSQIDLALEHAKKIDALVFLDIQVGHSTLQQEIPKLKDYLKLENVHLGIDPEYSMKSGHVPGTRIGTFDAADINYASEYLASLVKEYNIPPKILVVHRFTHGMVTNAKNIQTRPEVQIVMHMDGFGYPAKKESSYKIAVTNDPVEFAGFKIFYKQDMPNVMGPDEILKLYPKPVYIQYQ